MRASGVCVCEYTCIGVCVLLFLLLDSAAYLKVKSVSEVVASSSSGKMLCYSDNSWLRTQRNHFA